MDLKILDLFSGIGGFSYAAERIVGGYKTTQFVEVDPYCQSVLRKNFPNTPIHDDIRTFTAKPFQYDILCGGFPCQDISVAGKSWYHRRIQIGFILRTHASRTHGTTKVHRLGKRGSDP